MAIIQTQTENQMKINQTKRNQLNRKLVNLIPTYCQHIPMDLIFQTLENEGVVVVQEDGTRWEGMLCGEEGRTLLDLADARELDAIQNASLMLSWYKMESGRFEITVYVS